MKQLLDGGGQENGFRSSTQPAPLIFGFEVAAKMSFDEMEINIEKAISLNKMMKEKLTSIVPGIRFPFEETSPFILTFLIPQLPSDVMLRHLEQDQIYISSSSACSSKIKGPNPIFSALGIDETYHKNVFRISFSGQNNPADIDEFIKSFKKHYENLKKLMR